MAYLNENYLKLQAGYLFPEVARRVREFCGANPEAAKRLIRCGIGDVTEPLPRAAIEVMKRAVEELGRPETFRGYGPEQGYEFLRSTIAQRDYRDRKVDIADDEIFISDGSKCDCGYILDILGDRNKVAVPDPVYPVYVDTSRQMNMSILSIYVFRTTQLAQLHRVSNSRAGLNTRVHTKRFSSSTPPTKHTFPTRKFLIPFSKFPERANARLSSAVFQRTAGSRVCVAASR